MLSGLASRTESRPEEYQALLGDVVQVLSRDASQGNAARTQLYWSIGRIIQGHLEERQFPGRALLWLSEDLQRSMPALKGLSCRNLQYMRKFARLWPNGTAGGQGTMQLPWGHITVLLDKLDEPGEWPMIADKALREQWTRTTLAQACADQAYHGRSTS